MTASTSGRSSTISSPIVPFPAMTASSLKACTCRPSRPSNVRVRKTSCHSSKVTGIMSAPSRLIAAILVSGAVSGRTTVQCTPSLRAHQATPCAMFPALAVQTPCSSSSGEASSERVPRAAQLEGADRLQVLELEVDLRRSVLELEPHERRADDRPGEALAGGFDLGQSDHSSTSVPTPSSSARR